MGTTGEPSRVKDSLVARGQQLYEERLKSLLEPEHTGTFVAIEPETGRYFLGSTGTEALVAALREMPESRFYLKRVGYDFTDRVRATPFVAKPGPCSMCGHRHRGICRALRRERINGRVVNMQCGCTRYRKGAKKGPTS